MGFLLRSLGIETLSGSGEGDVPPTSPSPVVPSRAYRPDGAALALPAVLRSLQIIAGMASQLPLQTWHNGRLADTDHPLVRKPDPWRPRSSWVERVVVNLFLDGNAFLLKHRDPTTGTVMSLEVLDSARVAVKWNEARTVKRYEYRNGGKVRTYGSEDVSHIWFLEIPGRDRGTSPLGWCRETVQGIHDVKAYADTWFSNPDQPSGILTTDQKLNTESANLYADRWHAPRDGQNGPRVRVLGQGLTYAHLALEPAKVQWLEVQNFGVLDVARLTGVSADYLLAKVEGTSLTYSNLEMVDAQFLRTTLIPLYLRKIEDALSENLVATKAARFDTSELLRPDAKTRAEIDSIYLARGVYGGEHVRTREGIPADANHDAAPTPVQEPTA